MEKIQIQNLANILGKMKSLKRTGWVKRQVKNPESDAEHSYSLAMLALLLAPKNLDLLKCLKLALIHDLPEIFCGDLLPGELPKSEKEKLELNAMQKIACDLNMPELTELFTEYEQHKTPEAEFVWALDRLDNVFTARFYENEQNISLVKEFTLGAKSRIGNLSQKSLSKRLQKILEDLN